MTCRASCLALAVLVTVTACKSENRDFKTVTDVAESPALQLSALHAGGPGEPSSVEAFQDNRWAVSEGKRLYEWFNCAGCHSPGGGGAMGPPFIDPDWIYGDSPQNVFASIVEGRPNGMPSFRDRIDPADVWKLVGYVRTLGSLTPRDVWPERGDELSDAQREGPRSESEATSVPVEPPPPVRP
jgi:cytochrome c oxidase cbb3-type subunit 3